MYRSSPGRLPVQQRRQFLQPIMGGGCGGRMACSSGLGKSSRRRIRSDQICTHKGNHSKNRKWPKKTYRIEEMRKVLG